MISFDITQWYLSVCRHFQIYTCRWKDAKWYATWETKIFQDPWLLQTRAYFTLFSPQWKLSKSKGERRVEKTDLKLNIQTAKSVASAPITSQIIEGEKVEIVIDFIFLGSKITANSDWSHQNKRRFFSLEGKLWQT